MKQWQISAGLFLRQTKMTCFPLSESLNKTYRPIGLNLTHTVAYNSRKEQQLNSVLFIVLHTV